MSESSKIALVTGAGSGVGQAAALALMDAGFTCVLAGRRMETLEETRGDRSNGVCIAADVTQDADVEKLFGAIEDKFGRLDVLFNNAGTFGKADTIDQTETEMFRAVMDVNVYGSYLCARAAFALMRKQNPQGGRIINNGSISAYAPRPGSVAYTTSKHAITGLTKTLALDGRPYSIACGQLDIGNAKSALTEAIEDGIMQAHGEKMVEPVMDPSNVGKAVVHMASLPLDANVLFMNIMATNMPFVGRG